MKNVRILCWSTIIKVQSQNSRKFDKIISNESEEEQ